MPGTWQETAAPERQPFIQHAVNICLFTIICGIFQFCFLFQCTLDRACFRILSLIHGYGKPFSRGQVSADVKGLSKLPNHLSVILSLDKLGSPEAGARRLVAEAAELVAWCAEANISMLSVYEKTGT